LAREAQKRGQYAASNEQLLRILKIDPQNQTAIQLKIENDKAIIAQRGTLPSPEAIATIPDRQQEILRAATLAQDGKLFYEMGKLPEADKKLKEAYKLDPENRVALYYLSLLKERGFVHEHNQRELMAKEALVQVEKEWNPSIKREALPFPNPVTHTPQVFSSPGRQQIMSKLDKIRMNAFYDGLPLGEVLKDLTDKTVKYDPEKAGINFMIQTHAEAVPVATTPTDPNAPAVVLEPPAPVDISAITIKLNPELRNLRLADVLDAIVNSADQPIKFEVKDYAVVFSPRPPEAVTLVTKRFRVDPNTFLQGLESVSALSLEFGATGGKGRGGGGGAQDNTAFSIPRVALAQIVRGGGGAGAGAQAGLGINYVTKTNLTARVNEMVRDYFTTAGVDMTPPRSVFWNERAGVLFVKASAADLDLIASAVDALNVAPPQVTIKARFAEITQEDSKALGFDWFLGNTLLNGGAIGAQTGSAPSYSGRPTVANPSGTFPGPGFGPGFPGPGATFPSSTDNKLTTGIRNRIGSATIPNANEVPALATITGVLTDPQFRVVIHALEQRGGVDVLSAPSITTLSGRQAEISVLTLNTIVASVDIDQQASGGTANGTGGSSPGVIGSTITYFVQPLPFGTTLDVVPYVSADDYSIQMSIIPTITEFLGYDNPGQFVPQGQSAAGNTIGVPLTAVLPLPRLGLRQVTTSCNVYDGQTVVLGGLITENVNKIKDKIPVLGDLPFVGRLFRSESQNSVKRNLMIFVTPTIIDPAGNRVHSDEELPFAQAAIPQQTTIIAPVPPTVAPVPAVVVPAAVVPTPEVIVPAPEVVIPAQTVPAPEAEVPPPVVPAPKTPEP
ncbi:MAG: hypothetical protein ACR2H1_05550, partial [Limisphaerales bacterium]